MHLAWKFLDPNCNPVNLDCNQFRLWYWGYKTCDYIIKVDNTFGSLKSFLYSKYIWNFLWGKCLFVRKSPIISDIFFLAIMEENFPNELSLFYHLLFSKRCKNMIKAFWDTINIAVIEKKFLWFKTNIG